jgi:uncharacterized protein YqcC (DUF446 family)
MRASRKGGPTPQAVAGYADRIEAALRNLGVWQAHPLPPERMDSGEAFAQDTMAFTEWLQFVFPPGVREAAARGAFPQSSEVGVQAAREFDGWPEAGPVTTLLSEFDALFERRRRGWAGPARLGGGT